MKTKLENLIEFGDFKSGWRAEQAKKTKRTETGLDILKEDLDNDLDSDLIDDGLPTDDFDDRGIEELVPEGLPEEEDFLEQDIDHILDELPDLDDDTIDEVVNYLREILLEMEQNGEIEENFTDDLDNLPPVGLSGEWINWIEEVIQLPELSEEAIRGVSDIIFGGSREDRFEEDLTDDEELDTATSIDELDKIPNDNDED